MSTPADQLAVAQIITAAQKLKIANDIEGLCLLVAAVLEEAQYHRQHYKAKTS